jgi:hypothetical protein
MAIPIASVTHIGLGALRCLALGPFRTDAPVRFVAAFGREGLVPLDAEGREMAWLASGCIGCGACEHPSLSPRALLLASRSLQDLDRIEEDVRVLAGLEEQVLDALTSACPAAIPFGRLARCLAHMLDTRSNLG